MKIALNTYARLVTPRFSNLTHLEISLNYFSVIHILILLIDHMRDVEFILRIEYIF